MEFLLNKSLAENIGIVLEYVSNQTIDDLGFTDLPK